MKSSLDFRCSEIAGARFVAATAVTGWLLLALSAHGADRVAADRPPAGLSAAGWSGIRAAWEAKRHEAFAVEGGYLARNPGQQWRTRFDGRGFVTTPDGGGWSWGLELVGYGRGDQSRDRQAAGSQPACMEASGARVAYEWDDTLTEWYVNDRCGLEHGYTLHRRPDSNRLETGAPANPPLQFTLAVRGDLRPRIGGDGRDVTFVDAAGAAVVNYSGLKVFDANGTDVPAWFE